MGCILTFNADDASATFLIVPDTYTTATHTATAKITKFPIESGAKVSDHMILEPRTVALEMIVSVAGDDVTVQPSHSPDRPRSVWETLLSAQLSRTPFRADIGADSYAVCGIEDLTHVDLYENGDSYKITLKLQEMLIANAQTVPAFRLKVGLRSGGKRNQKGVTMPTTATAQLRVGAEYNAGNYIDAAALATGYWVFGPYD